LEVNDDQIKDLPGDISRAILAATQAAGENLRLDMIVRVHEKGKATDGTRIGSYSKGYAKTREKKGRQSRFVDLDFTGVLRQSLINLPNKEGFILRYLGGGSTSEGGVSAAQKMRFAETNKRWGNPGKGRPIIDPNEDEITNFVKSIADGFIRRL